PCFDIHVTVVGVTAEAVPSSFELLVQLVKQEITQEWRKRATLGRSFPSLLHHPVDHNARLEVPSDELEKPLIRDTVGEPSHKDVVVDPIEKFLQIAVYYPRITLCDVLLGLLHRL